MLHQVVRLLNMRARVAPVGPPRATTKQADSKGRPSSPASALPLALPFRQ
jgi:hypothetical protein